MWFKYYQREDWRTRLWKGYNLKMEANTYGCTRTMSFSRLHSFVFKVFRTEGIPRMIIFTSFWGSLFVYLSLTKEKREQKAILAEQKNQETKIREIEDYKKNQKLNRFNKPVMPHASLDSFLSFIVNGTAMQEALAFSSEKNFSKINQDQQKGLDSWLPRSDQELIEFGKSDGAKKGHH